MKESRSELKIRKCLRRSLGSYLWLEKRAGVKIHPVFIYLFFLYNFLASKQNAV